MDNLYAEPPHLSISLFCEEEEIVTHARLCHVLEEFECTRLGTLQVTARGRPFEFPSDLGTASKVIDVGHSDWERLTRGRDDDSRVLRAGYKDRKVGKVVAGYLGAPATERHPLELSMGSGALGFPEHLWSKQDKSQARARARWAKKLARKAVADTNAQYASIAVEHGILSPSWMTSGLPAGVTEIFISHNLLTREPQLEQKMLETYSPDLVEAWEKGDFYSSWAPFTPKGTATVSDLAHIGRDVVRALSHAVRR